MTDVIKNAEAVLDAAEQKKKSALETARDTAAEVIMDTVEKAPDAVVSAMIKCCKLNGQDKEEIDLAGVITDAEGEALSVIRDFANYGSDCAFLFYDAMLENGRQWAFEVHGKIKSVMMNEKGCEVKLREVKISKDALILIASLLESPQRCFIKIIEIHRPGEGEETDVAGQQDLPF